MFYFRNTDIHGYLDDAVDEVDLQEYFWIWWWLLINLKTFKFCLFKPIIQFLQEKKETSSSKNTIKEYNRRLNRALELEKQLGRNFGA